LPLEQLAASAKSISPAKPPRTPKSSGKFASDSPPNLKRDLRRLRVILNYCAWLALTIGACYFCYLAYRHGYSKGIFAGKQKGPR
jgi:hypothetical protein